MGGSNRVSWSTGMLSRQTEDFAHRTRLPASAVETLAGAGAFTSLGLTRRQAPWGAGMVSRTATDMLPGTAPGIDAPDLPDMPPVEETLADLWATGTSVSPTPPNTSANSSGTSAPGVAADPRPRHRQPAAADREPPPDPGQPSSADPVSRSLRWARW